MTLPAAFPLLFRCLLILAAVALTARLGGDGATLARQAAGMSHLTVEAR